MANYLMMVKVAAYRLKYIHLQIYNFHLEEATFLSKSQGLPIAVNEDFHILQTRKCIKFSVPMIQGPLHILRGILQEAGLRPDTSQIRRIDLKL